MYLNFEKLEIWNGIPQKKIGAATKATFDISKI